MHKGYLNASWQANNIRMDMIGLKEYQNLYCAILLLLHINRSPSQVQTRMRVSTASNDCDAENEVVGSTNLTGVVSKLFNQLLH